MVKSLLCGRLSLSIDLEYAVLRNGRMLLTYIYLVGVYLACLSFTDRGGRYAAGCYGRMMLFMAPVPL